MFKPYLGVKIKIKIINKDINSQIKKKLKMFIITYV